MIRDTSKTSVRAVAKRAGLRAQRSEEVIVTVQVGSDVLVKPVQWEKGELQGLRASHR